MKNNHPNSLLISLAEIKQIITVIKSSFQSRHRHFSLLGLKMEQSELVSLPPVPEAQQLQSIEHRGENRLWLRV